MVVEIKEYASAEKLADRLDKQIGDTEGLKYLVVEDEGVPERILFKIY
jgi:hypothetical protein